MPNYTINPADVKRANTTGNVQSVTWGETVAAGQSVYLDRATGTWMLGDPSDAAKPASDEQLGYALSSGGAGQTGSVIQGRGARIAVGAHGGRVGDTLINRPGGNIGPAGDLAENEYLVIMGYTVSDTEIELLAAVTEVQGGPTS